MAAATIGALRVVLGADTAAFSKDLGGAQKRLMGFSIDAKKAGALIGTALVAAAVGISAAVKRTINDADDLSKMSKKIGIPVEELSRLRYAADLSGVSFETLTKGIQRFSRNIFEGAQGFSTPIRAFATLGIEIKNADGRLKTVGEALPEIAERFKTMRDGTEKTALAMQLFGRAGAEMIPLLNEGADGVRNLMNEADQLGIVIDSKAAAAAEEFNDNLTRLGTVGEAFTVSIVNKMTPSLVTVTEKMLAAKMQLNEWGREFKIFLGILDETDEKLGTLSFGEFTMPGATAPEAEAPDIVNEVEQKRALSEAEAEHNQLLSDKQSLLNAIATPAQQYQSDLDEINRLYKAGVLDATQYEQAQSWAAEQSGLKWDQASASIAGSFGQIASAFGDSSSSMAKAGQAFGVVQAIISTYTGMAKALELPFPANIAAAAAVAAQGFGFVASIKGQKVPNYNTGADFMVGGKAGIDNNLVQFNATKGERVQVTPADEVGKDTPKIVEVHLHGRAELGRPFLRELAAGLSDVIGDGTPMRISPA